MRMMTTIQNSNAIYQNVNKETSKREIYPYGRGDEHGKFWNLSIFDFYKRTSSHDENYNSRI